MRKFPRSRVDRGGKGCSMKEKKTLPNSAQRALLDIRRGRKYHFTCRKREGKHLVGSFASDGKEKCSYWREKRHIHLLSKGGEKDK